MPSNRSLKFCRVFCATANPTEVIVAVTEQGRGIMGVVDGPRRLALKGKRNCGTEELLRRFGYKL
jgi:adenosine/AMP kinase